MQHKKYTLIDVKQTARENINKGFWAEQMRFGRQGGLKNE